jgi:hypothetical protein
MPATLVYSSREHKSERITNVYYGVTRDYILASRLIDAIILAAKQRSKIVVDRGRFTYVPTDGTRKMVIRLKPHH